MQNQWYQLTYPSVLNGPINLHQVKLMTVTSARLLLLLLLLLLLNITNIYYIIAAEAAAVKTTTTTVKTINKVINYYKI